MQLGRSLASVALGIFAACSANPATFTRPPSKTDEQAIIRERLVEQRQTFSSMLFEVDSSINKTGLNCNVLAVYNNLAISGELYTDSGRRAFPDTKSEYVDGCRTAYQDLQIEKLKLVAEPELVPTRKKISELVEVLDEMALYALDGKGDALVIDSLEKREDALRTEAVEELIAAQREINDL